MSLQDKLNAALKKRGIVFLEDDQKALSFLEAIKDNPTGIEFFSQYGLAMLFFYRKEEQPEDLKKYDGMAVEYKNPDTGDAVYCIGISEKSLSRNKDDINLLWLHEAAHILHGDVTAHDQRFYDLLNVLISEYNSATGSHLPDQHNSPSP